MKCNYLTIKIKKAQPLLLYNFFDLKSIFYIVFSHKYLYGRNPALLSAFLFAEMWTLNRLQFG